MKDDDISLPTPPALNTQEEENYDEFESSEIQSQAELQSKSSFPLQLDFSEQKVEESDLSYLTLQPLEKKILISELSDCDLYLKNIHKGFSYVRSTRSLIALVGAGLATHKHRRQVIKDIKESKKDPFELDEHGNIKS